ncbi:hypothetical protein AX27061_0697 [Achromobacter xylosoxidans NBRC 15126 = ATCC 27061]|nr:hypothetical protein AX27061_0697 [Achromobacter xylosoxidans NBRC 15126 = ATCC 27061]
MEFREIRGVLWACPGGGARPSRDQHRPKTDMTAGPLERS